MMTNNKINNATITNPWENSILGPMNSRIVMSAMTRSAAPNNIPTSKMAEYYSRRAKHGVGLIITESTATSSTADGFPNAPRIITDGQITGWKKVTDAVHKDGGIIFCQLNHCGRISHTDYTDGQQPVSATDQRARGINKRNNQPYSKPKRLSQLELKDVINEFRTAANKCMLAGFDGVELHMAHGYLLDQFLDSRVNDRNDEYGGAIEGRCRFPLELASVILEELGENKVMVRISPSRWMGGVYDWPDLDEMLEYLLPNLDKIGLRMLDISCANANYFDTSGRIIRKARPLWPHLLLGGASLSKDDAQNEVNQGLVDLVTYGRLLISNPDLVQKFRAHSTLDEYHPNMLDRLE
ncbi:MAG: alkene reductase [Flavobacteriaceae bacterium]|nr:alkene reductase [Flavobacteriaceae bacterium]|tara:strand:+ start:398 stop:1459 length:1062 start_codon:yes stop_codon:yes gene_type:complete